MSGLFEGDIFAGPRRGYGGFGAFGALPTGAESVSASLSRWRGQFPAMPSDATLASKVATHYTTRVVGPTSQEFTFYDGSGRVVVGPLTLWHRRAERPAEPALANEPEAEPMARRDGDGLLPSAAPLSNVSSAPGWLPWLLVGGGALVAGGIVFAASRRPKVAANRRRRRRRRRRR